MACHGLMLKHTHSYYPITLSLTTFSKVTEDTIDRLPRQINNNHHTLLYSNVCVCVCVCVCVHAFVTL